MATSTTNIGLTKPLGTEKVQRSVINENYDKIDSEFGQLNFGYGVCGSDAAATAKVVTLAYTNWKLVANQSFVAVKFSATNTGAVASLTLNVNSTGAKPIKYRGANLSKAGLLIATRTYLFAYDGTNWEILGDMDTNTTYSNASLGQGYGTCPTAAATVAKLVTLASYSLTVGGVVSVAFTYDVPASATMNVNSKGAKPMFYQGAAIIANVIQAGDIATFIYDGTNYVLISIDRAAGMNGFFVKNGKICQRIMTT